MFHTTYINYIQVSTARGGNAGMGGGIESHTWSAISRTWTALPQSLQFTVGNTLEMRVSAMSRFKSYL